MKLFVPDPKTGRCMCNLCGGRKQIDNPYIDSITINRIATRNEEAKAAQQKEEEEAKKAQQKEQEEAKATERQKEEEKRNEEVKQIKTKKRNELPPPVMKQPPRYSFPQQGSI